MLFIVYKLLGVKPKSPAFPADSVLSEPLGKTYVRIVVRGKKLQIKETDDLHTVVECSFSFPHKFCPTVVPPESQMCFEKNYYFTSEDLLYGPPFLSMGFSNTFNEHRMKHI